MWKINKPDIKRATIKDIFELKKKAGLDIVNTIRLRQLYIDYDNQKGDVSKNQISIIPKDITKKIHDAYPKTRYGNDLDYIREELNKNVYRCPYCGIGSSSDTLDHYMPESKFGALAVCRMNLVPMCFRCNNLKKTKPYKNFVHCYYENFPNGIFFVADIRIVRNCIIANFNFDSSVINDTNLENKLRKQATEIRLFERIKKAANEYITNLCIDCDVPNNKCLQKWLKDRLKKEEDKYGKNDWRSAVVRGMLNCSSLNISTINSHKKTRPTNNDGGI